MNNNLKYRSQLNRMLDPLNRKEIIFLLKNNKIDFDARERKRKLRKILNESFQSQLISKDSFIKVVSQ